MDVLKEIAESLRLGEEDAVRTGTQAALGAGLEPGEILRNALLAGMAIVGEERWRDLTLLFTSQGLRPFPIEFFTSGQLAEARAWLAGG